MGKVAYKFNYWPLILVAGILLFAIYMIAHAFFRIEYPTTRDYLKGGLLLMACVFILIVIFPVVYKSIIGVPALVLTPEHLINNARGRVFDWHDIAQVKPRGTFFIIVLKDPAKYFTNRFIRKLYLFSTSLPFNEYGISLNLLLGNNKEILSQVKAYHEKFGCQVTGTSLDR